MRHHARRRARRAGLAIASLVLAWECAGCARDPGPVSRPGAAPVYTARPDSAVAGAMRFAVHPLYNPSMLGRAYQPLMDHLNARLPGRDFVLEASRDYARYEEKIRAREPEFLLANPFQALMAMRRGYTVIAEAGEPADFRGVFIVRRDGPVRTLADVKGRVIAYPAPTALAACIMPQWYLHEHGIDVNRDIENFYVGSQESAILSVLLGRSAVGVTWPPPWREFTKARPADAAQLRVAWETEPLVNNSVLVRNDVPPAVRDSVRQLLLGLEGSAGGRAILSGMETARFLRADSATYAPVRRFVDRFSSEVRPLDVN